MYISHINLCDFRNYREVSLNPDPGLNIFLGKNAQGKTTILEAIYMLAIARSWKAGKDSELIRWESERARVSAEVIRREQNDVDIDIVISRTEKKLVKVNTIRQTRLADLMGQVNVVLIEPHDVEIVRTDPSRRRKFLDMEISQIQPQYCHLLGSYRKVLDQRNKLLKDMQHHRVGGSVLGVWTDQLISYGAKIIERRLSFIRHIADLARVIHSQITEGSERLSVTYASNIKLEGTENVEEIAVKMRAYIDERHNEEIRRGVTLAGPQRDDLVFAINNVDTRIYGSQGQQRTVALSLRLAELEVMEETAGEPPIVLLDDVMTDLDEGRRTHMFEMTRGRCQTFVTAASPKLFDSEFLTEGMIYKVSEGRVYTE
ncbi:MAG: DNA replication/repair protein RecF [Armatimonadota bacterium]